MSTTGYVKSS